jgi:hypothetical protein
MELIVRSSPKTPTPCDELEPPITPCPPSARIPAPPSDLAWIPDALTPAVMTSRVLSEVPATSEVTIVLVDASLLSPRSTGSPSAALADLARPRVAIATPIPPSAPARSERRD